MTDPEGTRESDWQLDSLPTWAFERAGRVVLVSPHPDDETLGAGGLLSVFARAGCDVTVIALSDGEAAYPEARAQEREALARQRSDEQMLALGELGVDARACVRWGLPDGDLCHVTDLAERLTEVLRGARYCLAPFCDDGHPDHDAAGRASAVACAHTGTTLCEFPIWAWHWRRPAEFAALWSRGQRVSLDEDTQQRKQRALRHYQTQTRGFERWGRERPVLPPSVLAHFARSFETFLV